MTYQEILKNIGWPEEVLVIDFESYFDQDYSLKKMSTIEYIQDPRFGFTGMGSYYEAGEASVTLFLTPDEIEVYINQINWNGVTVIAKHCKFDITILATKFGIIPSYIIDIDDLLRHYDARMSHKLKDVTKLFGLPPKGDTNQFKGFHYEDMDQEMRNALSAYCLRDIEDEVELFKILLPMITNPAVEIPVARHTLDLYLRPRITFDFKAAGELRAEMLTELDRIVDVTGHKAKELSSPLKFTKILQDVLPEDQQVPVKPGKPGKNMIKLLGQPGIIPAFAKDDVGFQELLAHPDETVRRLCLARQAVKSWPLHTKRIDNMANQADCCNGLLPVSLHYFGAHTGRFSGGEKINLQNLGGRGRAGQGTHPLIQQMRNLLCAPDGSILGIADSAQIEARILAWLAGQDDLVEGFANGKDIYSVFATKLFNSCVYKPKEDEFAPIKHLLKIRRGFGKDAILGCGYGMGANTFYQRCIANGDLRPLFDSGAYDWDFIANLIRTYRTTYSRIPEFWKAVEKAFKWVIKYPHEHVGIADKIDRGRSFLRFWNNSGTVNIQLPSGRCLTYRHCALKQTTRGSQIRWHYGHLWGGSITENIVQAVARDLLAYWILEMDKAGLKVVLHSHDEIICMIEKDHSPPPTAADMDLDKMLTIMCTGPDWVEGLPLDAEGCLAERYQK